MITLDAYDLKSHDTDILIIPVCEDGPLYADRRTQALTRKVGDLPEFTGKRDTSVTLYDIKSVGARRVCFVGLGKRADVRPETVRAALGRAIKSAVKNGFSTALCAIPSAEKLGVDPDAAPVAMMEGACLSNHIFDRYKKEKKYQPLERIDFFPDGPLTESHRKLPARIEAVCEGTVLAREWVSTPSNDKTPEVFARDIARMAKKRQLKVKVLDPRHLTRKRFGAIHAVAAGSEHAPRLVVVEWSPARAKKTLVLVGKGVTFDSGGINLKPGSGLADMKCDMAGAAAVAGTMAAVAALKPDLRVVGVMPLVENMPSGSATRPGDVIRTYTGKTVEVGNTDAEGRLILADAIAYAIDQYAPDITIDLATLTGACVVALGERLAGVFSEDEALVRLLVDAGNRTHERCWQMPLPEDYRELLKSDVADISNMSSTRYGGAITAALFLSEFVRDTRWAHIDIAGPAYAKKAGDYCGSGGTGFGVRLLCEALACL